MVVLVTVVVMVLIFVVVFVVDFSLFSRVYDFSLGASHHPLFVATVRFLVLHSLCWLRFIIILINFILVFSKKK